VILFLYEQTDGSKDVEKSEEQGAVMTERVCGGGAGGWL